MSSFEIPTLSAAYGVGTEEAVIAGVAVRPIASIDDRRGSLCEIHRDDWGLAPRPVQWDFVTSRPQVLRGVHVHCLRWDYIIVLKGRATIGLKDVRRGERSFRHSMLIDVSGERPTLLTIPPGVAHGIFADTALSYIYGLTVAWDGSDEDLGCRHDDPELGIKWPSQTPIMMPRDLALPNFATLLRDYESKTVAGFAAAAPV
jgi:dTDP-4-dehydrorhamnose 3,5-epimerase